MMLRKIRCDMSKALTGCGFWVCAVFTVILCFSANIYTDTIKNDRYSAFSALRAFDREFMLSDMLFCSFNVIMQAAGSWLPMFIPIISAFSFVPIMCDEYESRSVRFEIFRTSRTSYHISRFVTSFLCGGLAVTIGYAAFSGLSCILFPSINDYPQAEKEMFIELLSDSFPELVSTEMIPILKILGSMFLYGAVSALPAVTLTAVIRNKYLVLCIPFFLKYALGQLCMKLQSQTLADYTNIDEKLLRIVAIIHPDGLAHLTQAGENTIAVLVYNGIFVLILLSVYLIIQTRRTDCGE